MTPRDYLLAAYRAALEAVDGHVAVRHELQTRPLTGPIRLVAIGKAAGPMASGAIECLGDDLVDGIVIHPHGSPAPEHPRLTVMPSAHPLPDERSLRAGAALEDFVSRAPRDARFLFLLSGGASSLVESLPAGGSIEGLTELNRRLLADGLAIHQINRVRRAVSRIKGGRLGQLLSGRRARALLISDVRGDDPAVIGSGLLFPPPSCGSQPSDMPEQYAGLVPAAAPGPQTSDPALRAIEAKVVASNDTARNAAASYLRNGGITATPTERFLDGDAVIEGEAIADAIQCGGPGVLIWGGEPTVRLPENPGCGGRMQALALAAARRLEGTTEFTVLTAGTDGIDGDSRAAGALVDGGTVARGRELGLLPDQSLAAADSGLFLDRAGDLIITGPTGTNVMDLVMAMRHPSAP